MKKISTTDILAVGLILISVYLFMVGNLLAKVGAVIIIIAELVYLWQTKISRWFK